MNADHETVTATISNQLKDNDMGNDSENKKPVSGLASQTGSRLVFEGLMTETRYSSGNQRGTGVAYFQEKATGTTGDIVFPIPADWTDIRKSDKLKITVELIRSENSEHRQP